MAQLLERGPQLLRHLPAMRHLSGAFGPLVDRHLQDPFLRHWVDLLCFLISGMPMGDTNAAAMATLFGDWFDPEASLDYPVGGSAAVVDALVQGLQRHGGTLRTQARVEQILVEDGRACGVRLADGDCIRADQVVSNADIWSTLALLPDGVASSWSSDRAATPACRGFLHLHLGFDASGLDDLPIHTVWVDDWERGIAADRNAVVLSVPSVLDPAMAPPGAMFCTPTPRRVNPGSFGAIWSAAVMPTTPGSRTVAGCSGPCWSGRFPISASGVNW